MGVFMLIITGLIAIVGGGACAAFAAGFLIRDDTAGAFGGGALAGVLAVLSVLSGARSGYVVSLPEALQLGAGIYLVAGTLAITRFAHVRLWQGLVVAAAGLALLAGVMYGVERGLDATAVARSNLDGLGLY